MNKIKVFEAFVGYGGWSFGLKKAGIDFDVVGYSERDKYAIQCYEQNHNFDSDIKEGFRFPPRNYGDIKKIVPEELPDFDLFCASPPCQSFSTAGKGLGKDDERGDLFEYAINIMKVKQPKYAIYENVKGLVSKRHKDYFDYIIKLMKDAGYHVYWKVLNTKDYGVPQNRERVFIVCYRNDINKNYPFPEKEELKIFLKDILEDKVDEKYYLKEEQMNNLMKNSNMNCNPSGKGMNGKVHYGDISPTITTNKGEGAKIIQVNNPKHSNNRVYSDEGLSPTLNTMNGGNRQPFIVASRGRNSNNLSLRVAGMKTEQRLEPKFNGTTNTLTSVQKDNLVFNGRIRKLTPRECFRLQGFLDDEINLEGLSNTQQYKLAGNGLSINVVAKIFEAMFK